MAKIKFDKTSKSLKNIMKMIVVSKIVKKEKSGRESNDEIK